MTLTLCAVSGVMHDSAGAVLASKTFKMVRTGTVASTGTSPDKVATAPYVQTVTTDGSGNVSFSAYPGSYQAVMARDQAPALIFEMAVPDAATADIADIIDSVSAMTPTLLQEATAARDAAQAALVEFEATYLGAKSSAPSVDNEGNPLQTGASYFDTTADEYRVWNGSAWLAVAGGMAVGAFGLGVTTTPPVLADFNATDIAVGFYQTHSTTLNRPSAFPHAFGSAIFTRYSGGGSGNGRLFWMPNYESGNTPSLWLRNLTNGAWADPVRVFDTNHIVGTVSQTGGVPTGAIIERGSNANGEYTRWADGTQVATNSNSAITTAPAAFTGTITKIDSDKLWLGFWF